MNSRGDQAVALAGAPLNAVKNSQSISDTRDTLVLKPSPFKWLGFAAFWSLLGGIGWVKLEEGWRIIGGLGVLYGVVGTVLCFARIFMRKFEVTLNPAGIASGTWGEGVVYPWDKIKRFTVGQVAGSEGVRVEYFNEIWSEWTELRRTDRRARVPPTGLPDSYGMWPQELADLLEDWRKKYSTIRRKNVEP